MLEITVSVPPSDNNLFPTGKHGKRFPSKEYEAWQKEAGWQLNIQRAPKHEGPYGLIILIPRAVNHRGGDLSNRQKAIIDLLVKHEITVDDKHLGPFLMDWHEGDDAIVYVGAPDEFTVKPIPHLGAVNMKVGT